LPPRRTRGARVAWLLVAVCLSEPDRRPESPGGIAIRRPCRVRERNAGTMHSRAVAVASTCLRLLGFGAQGRVHCRYQPVPALRFLPKATASAGSQAVELGAPVVFRRTPLRGQ